MRWFTRLRRPAAFAKVRQRGKRVGLRTLRAFGLPRRTGPVRVGITVPSSVGGAVVRNLVRRRVEGALDALPAAVRPQPVDLVFAMLPAAAQAGYATIAGEVEAALTKLSGRGVGL